MSKLQEALVAIGREVGTVAKTSENTHHKYKYASAEAVLSKVREACHRHGVAITGSSAQLVPCEGGNRIVRICQTYSLGEESATFEGIGEGKDSQDKGTMKASTAALKYLLANAFNISWGDDPEASDPETGKSTATPAKGKGKPPAKAAGKASAAFETHSTAIAAMTPATQETVRAQIKADRDNLSEQEFESLVAAFRARAQ